MGFFEIAVSDIAVFGGAGVVGFWDVGCVATVLCLVFLEDSDGHVVAFGLCGAAFLAAGLTTGALGHWSL